MPRLTVVITCHNGGPFLRTAIGGVLYQGFADLEILVADDASSYDSREIAEGFGPPVRVIGVAHGNTQATRNAAIAASDSELIALLDQDDTWLPGKPEAQVRLLDARPELALCWTDTEVADAAGRVLPDRHNPLREAAGWPQALGTMLEVNSLAASSAILRRGVLDRVGTFDPAYHLAGDWDLWLRIAEEAPVAPLHRVLLRYCWHSGNASTQRVRMLRETIAVQQAALARVLRHPLWSRSREFAPYLPPARRKLAARWSGLGAFLGRDGHRAEALGCQRRALRLRPAALQSWLRRIRVALTPVCSASRMS